MKIERSASISVPGELLEQIPCSFSPRSVGIAEDGGWTTIFLEFNVFGTGETLTEALADAEIALEDYLKVAFENGQTFDEMIRPADPEVWKLFRQAVEADAGRKNIDTHDAHAGEELDAPQYFRQPLVAC